MSANEQEMDRKLLIPMPPPQQQRQQVDDSSSASGSKEAKVKHGKRLERHKNRDTNEGVSLRQRGKKQRQLIYTASIVAGVFLAGLLVLWFFHEAAEGDIVLPMFTDSPDPMRR